MNQLLEPSGGLAQGRLTEAHRPRRRLYLRHEVCALLRCSPTTLVKRGGSWPWVQECLPRVGRPKYLAAPIDKYVAGLWPCHNGSVAPRRTTR